MSPSTRERWVQGAIIVESLALAVWLGGWVVLGAIVAPTVFAVVGRPTNADAMVKVFSAFDKVAAASAMATVGAEAVGWLVLRAGGAEPSRWRWLRRGSVLVSAVLCMVQLFWIAPSIAQLHAAGALRGVGEAGLLLERVHRIAEGLGKLQVLSLAVAMALLVTDARPRCSAR
jgi:hypothetical protein